MATGVTKVFIIVMVLVFIDLIIQQFTGGDYGIIAVLTLLIRTILAFGGLIIHAIVNAIDPGKWHIVAADIELLIEGIIALLLWVGQSLVAVLFDIIRLPFYLIGGALEKAGLAFGFYIDLDAFGSLLIDFKTLTFIVKIGNINKLKLFNTGIILELENIIGFSFLGVPSYTMRVYSLSISNLGQLGRIVHRARLPGMRNGLSLYVFLDDRAWTKPLGTYLQIPPLIQFPITFYGSLKALFDGILASVPIPSLGSWVDTVWGRLLPQVPSHYLGLVHVDLEEIIRLCHRKKSQRRIKFMV